MAPKTPKTTKTPKTPKTTKTKATTAIAVAKKMPAARRTALLDLAARLGGGPVAVEVALAADDPAAYAKRFRARLTSASVAPTDPTLPWFALIEALRARKKLAALEPGHGPDTALASIHKLAPVPGRKALAALRTDPALADRHTHDAIQLAGGALGTAQLALLRMERPTTTAHLVIAAAADVRVLVGLARSAGARITPHGPTPPAGPARRRP